MSLAVQVVPLISKDGVSQAHKIIRAAIRPCHADHCNYEASIDGWVSNALRLLVDSEHVYHAINDQGVMMGVIAMSEHGDLKVNYVHPSWNGRGVGTAMLVHVEKMARAYELPVLTLESSATARRFYFRHGYVETGNPRRGVGHTWNFPMIKSMESVRKDEEE